MWGSSGSAGKSYAQPFSLAPQHAPAAVSPCPRAGLVRGAYEVAQDGCLYAEPFALRYVAERLGADTDTTRLLAAMRYFFGFQDIPDDQVRARLAVLLLLALDAAPWLLWALDLLASSPGCRLAG